MVKVKFKKLHPDAQLPKRAKPGDAGLDMTCVDDGVLTEELMHIKYKLGVAMEIPDGHVGLLFPRSSIYKTELTLSNAVAVIDSGYRGEVAAVFNLSMPGRPADSRIYKKGDRIVQLIVMPVPVIETEWTEELSSTERGDGGFGSTGK